jgi:sigma-B regulation protein RsbU (phosphoserine phosphatase)
MTLFFLAFTTESRQLEWVRAGPDPAIFYDPCSDTFEELGGTGIALGVDENWSYKAYEKVGLVNAQIIFLSTDGIWEAFNPKGEMFGKERIYDIMCKRDCPKNVCGFKQFSARYSDRR